LITILSSGCGKTVIILVAFRNSGRFRVSHVKAPLHLNFSIHRLPAGDGSQAEGERQKKGNQVSFKNSSILL